MKGETDPFQRRKMLRYQRSVDEMHPSGAFGAELHDWFTDGREWQKVADWLKAESALLLAHADDGIIWGKVNNGALTTSHRVAPELSPTLRAATLQQCRLFNSQGELLIWRDEEGFRARLLLDTPMEQGACEAFDEDQMLWGTFRLETEVLKQAGFTVVYEGQGLRHAVPLAPDQVEEELFGQESDERMRARPLRLTVRHYVEEDEEGFARITLSRLVKLHLEGDGK